MYKKQHHYIGMAGRTSKFFLAISLCFSQSVIGNENQSSFLQYHLGNLITGLTTGLTVAALIKLIGVTITVHNPEPRETEARFRPEFTDETFDSVAGVSEALSELEDIVQFLKSPYRYTKFGARPPRGVLLVGAPGNGKTLLAKALAGETRCSFYNVSGSEFVEVWVGLGAARVRELFAQARKNAPSIIFIDEIDAIGRKRGGGHGGSDEFSVTLNQLLIEMDGFATTDGVIVIAATNRVDVLDDALVRPGRFDRQVDVPYPDRHARKEVLELHAEKLQWVDDIDFDAIARRTAGFSCADLANLLNEAAILAARRPWSTGVTQEDVEEAYDKHSLGSVKKHTRLTIEEREQVAYHEAGHALIQMLYTKLIGPLHKVTIVPRGRALGVSYSDGALQERFIHSKEMLTAKICVALGGRAAEEIGCNSQSDGALNDFEYATHLARNMISSYGMSDEIGLVTYDYNALALTPEAAAKIDTAMRALLNDCMKKTKDLLIEHRDKLDRLKEELIAHETVSGDRAYQVVGLELPNRLSDEDL